MSFALIISSFSLFLLNPSPAQAGFFDFVEKVFASDGKSNINLTAGVTSSSLANSQNLPLLRAFGSGNAIPLAPEDLDITINGGALGSAGVSSLGNTVVDPGSDSTDKNSILYVVNTGDTVLTITKMFSIKEDTLLSVNGLKKGSKLSVGQILFIMPTDGVQITITKGDTLQGLAKKHKAEVKDIMEFNGLTNTTLLAIGEDLFIPNGTMKEVSAVFQNTASAPTTNKKAFGTTGPVLDGFFTRPIAAGIGIRTQGIHDHNSVDWGAPTGTPIMAVADGIVSASYYQAGRVWNGGWGNMVVLKHDKDGIDRGKAVKVQSLYAHMSKVYVKTGEFVKQGQIIGLVGSTGKSTGPHLHLEIWGAYNFLLDVR